MSFNKEMRELVTKFFKSKMNIAILCTFVVGFVIMFFWMYGIALQIISLSSLILSSLLYFIKFVSKRKHVQSEFQNLYLHARESELPMLDRQLKARKHTYTTHIIFSLVLMLVLIVALITTI